MKKTTILVIVVVILVVGAIGFYLYKNGKLFGSKPEEIKPEIKENVIAKDDFFIELPDGWAEVNASMGASATAIDTNEKITDANAQKINFRSYFSVVYDNLGDKSRDEYYQTIKDSLKQAFPDIAFTHEEKGMVGNKETYFLEAEFNQQEIDFKILLAINMGDKDVWIISFNTLKSSWDNYKDVFYQTARSFKAIEKFVTVKVFFNNDKMDPEFSCNKVFPVERQISKTQAVGQAAMEQLLDGPTDEEKSEGFFTSINSGVKIQELAIKDGIVKIDFSEQLEFQVGGSCRVSAIRAQITQTLGQFSDVKEVIISIDGRTEDILQP